MDKEMLNSEKQKVLALAEIQDLEGGKVLMGEVKTNVVDSINLLAGYQSKTDGELRDICANLKANLDLLSLMTGIEERLQLIENLITEAHS